MSKFIFDIRSILSDSKIEEGDSFNQDASSNLFQELSDTENQTVRGGYWAYHQHSSQAGGTLSTNRRNQPVNSPVPNSVTTISASSVQTSVATSNIQFSHHTAADRLDEVLLT